MQQGDHIDVCITCFRSDVTISMAQQPIWWGDTIRARGYRPSYQCPSGYSMVVRDIGAPEVKRNTVYTRGDDRRNTWAWANTFDSHREALRIQRDAYAVLLRASRLYGANMRVICDMAHQTVLRHYERGETQKHYQPEET